MKIGATIGADVPFFIYGKNAFGQGIGEKLKEVDMIPAGGDKSFYDSFKVRLLEILTGNFTNRITDRFITKKLGIAGEYLSN